MNNIGENYALRPFGVDTPSTQDAQATLTSAKMRSETMMTQMANQDPTAPQDSQEMASQLAQFSTLEVMQQTNEKLDALLMAQAAGNQTSMANLIGKDIKINSSELNHLQGEAENMSILLEGPAKEVTVTIKNEAGVPVRTLHLGTQGKGSFDVEWDGQNDDGNPAPEGLYSFSVGAVDENDEKVEASANIVAHVDGMSFENGFPELLCGDLRIALENVLEILEATS